MVTADQVQAQGARNLTQALRYTPGLATGGFTDRNSIADEITSRGFAPTPLYLDGAYLPYAGSLGAHLRSTPTRWSVSKCSRALLRCCTGKTSRAG